MNKTDEFWKSEGLDHIIPNTGEEFPEGFNVLEYLSNYIGDQNVVEIGCGYGRLCTAFDTKKYSGYDINPSAISKAVTTFHDYDFYLLKDEVDPKQSDIMLFYTVLLHISDEDIESFVGRFVPTTKKIIVAEIMDRKWRRGGNPPVFNRFLSDYNELFSKFDMKPTNVETVPYVRYKDTNITFVTYESNK